MTDRLGSLFQMQTVLQAEKMGGHPADFDDEKKIQFIKDMILALTDEAHEALQEVGWKPWATSRHINREAFHGELVDLLHFFINLCLVSELSESELYLKYVEKNQKNARRQDEGYDGVSTKCLGCGRALDDESTQCQMDIEEVRGDDDELIKVVKANWCHEKRDWFFPVSTQ